MKIYGYIRVSTKEQNEARQEMQLKEKGCDLVLMDKSTGKDFDRPNYNLLKKVVIEGDKVIFTELDRLGRDYDQIKEEIRYFDNLGVEIDFLDFPMPTTNDPLINKMLRDQIINTLAYVAQKELEKNKARRTQGIESMPIDEKTGKKKSSKTGRVTGRPKTEITQEFIQVYKQWKNKEMTAVKAMELLGLKRNTFYRLVKEYENKGNK
ncbi:recombinase family protein [Clostridium perfringens]|uniref:recombinase family protein n=1 Tax=Clostridium perfringens TaxID=1502 RepID=UPI00232EEB6B|nr:recombinase family protein [Clostridium perfringens]MDB2050322.1 recombinase family protein [Clostridium perfringens]